MTRTVCTRHCCLKVLFPLREEDRDEDYRDIFGSTDSESEEESEATAKPPSRPAAKKAEEENEKVKDKERPPALEKQPSTVGREESKEDLSKTQTLVADEHLGSGGKKLERDKENLLSQVRSFGIKVPKVPKPPSPAPKWRFKKRSANAEEELLMAFAERGLSREDVEMFKLALSRMRGGEEGEEEEALITRIHWAYYPHDILSLHPLHTSALHV